MRDITLESAKRKINALKGFYHHLCVFILTSTVLLATKGNIIKWVAQNGKDVNIEFLKWLDWNILAIPIIWGAVIVVQGFYVFEFPNLRTNRNKNH